MFPPSYVRPVAYHRFATDYLLLKDESDNWYLWKGGLDGLVQVERTLAQWIYNRPEIYPVAGPVMWFDVDSLPAANESQPTRHD